VKYLLSVVGVTLTAHGMHSALKMMTTDTERRSKIQCEYYMYLPNKVAMEVVVVWLIFFLNYLNNLPF
jgi:hypothetical protein